MNGDEETNITLADIIVLLRLNLRILLVVPVVLMLGVAAWTMTRPLNYTSSTAFSAGGGYSTAGISGIAAQFGLAGGGGSSDGPAFYEEVLKSSSVLEPIADSTLSYKGHTEPIWEAFGIEEANPERRRRLVAEVLRDQIETNVSRETGIVRVKITASDPEKGKQLLDILMNQLEEFNLRRRQEQAARERKFAETQLRKFLSEVESAEARLAEFSIKNRQYSSSPQLTVEFERLRRVLMDRQSQFATLQQTYNQALLEEIRNVPRLSLIEYPSIPLRPNPRGTTARAAAAFLLGLLLAIGLVLGREYLRASALVQAIQMDQPGSGGKLA